MSLADLRTGFDAVILAIGITSLDKAKALGLPVTDKGIEADRQTYLTSLPGVFAIGSALRPLKMAVRAGADGKECALACDQFLGRQTVKGEPKRFTCVIGNVTPPELQEMLRLVSEKARVEPGAGLAAGLSSEETAAEAGRCLHCDCRNASECRLREAVEQLSADARHYAESGRHLIELMAHPNGLVFEPGKCIKCGLCIRKARSFADLPGLTFIQRGYQSRVSPPTGETFVTALGSHTAEIVAVCPTGAMALDKP
jgi:ferredoxin